MTMTANNSTSYEVEVFYDGGCPLCRREIDMLKRWDKQRKIRFSDIDGVGFSFDSLGKTHEQLMAEIHGRLPDGTWLQGVEVFRRLYAAVGFRVPVALSRLPLVSQLLGVGYWLFAKNRLRLTGRCNANTCAVKPSAR
jgi:predicted DCC family thiol-disulfide oxidoreductase YuxK